MENLLAATAAVRRWSTGRRDGFQYVVHVDGGVSGIDGARCDPRAVHPGGAGHLLLDDGGHVHRGNVG